MAKPEKINKILELASGKPFKVIKARKALHFKKHGHDERLFICEETGEVLTEEQISAKYMHDGWTIDGLPMIQGVDVMENTSAGDVECTSILLLETRNDEILIKQNNNGQQKN